MTSFIFHRKNTSPTEYTFVRWIHLNHRKVDLSIGVRLPVLDIYGFIKSVVTSTIRFPKKFKVMSEFRVAKRDADIASLNIRCIVVSILPRSQHSPITMHMRTSAVWAQNIFARSEISSFLRVHTRATCLNFMICLYKHTDCKLSC